MALSGKRMPQRRSTSLLPEERIERAIRLIRGHKVILDADLAAIYGVATRRLNEQVKRNRDRFPEDFVFELSAEEFAILKSQSATASWGGRRTRPYAFTEHGALMAANVLKSETAVHTSIVVVRTFVRLREMLASHESLARKLSELEHRYDSQFKVVFEAIRELMRPPSAEQHRRRIGFHMPDKSE
jgi:hypothetical protein